MKRRIDVQSLAGFFALAALLLLLSPGVRAVRAQTPATTPDASAVELAPSFASEGEACRLEDARHGGQSSTAGAMARLQELLAKSGGRAGAADVQVLNGRGYNYGAAPEAIDSTLLGFDARQQATSAR